MRLTTRTTCATALLALALAGSSGGGGQAQPQQPASSIAASSASSATSAASSPAAATSSAPAARALAANSAQGLGGAVPQVPAPADPAAATVIDYDHSLRLLGAGPVDEVAAGVETLRPVDGQRLHLVRYALTTSPDPSASSASSSSSSGGLPTATVVAGRQRIPVPLSAGAAESAVVVSVPADASSVVLELESGAGVPAPPKQGLDLAAMTRLPGAPDVLYRAGGAAARTVELDVSEQLAYTRTLSGSYPVDGQTTVQASQARLAWWLAERSGSLRTPSRPDRALLVLTVAEGGGFDAVEYPPARWRLSYPGGPSGGQPAQATRQAGGVAPSRRLSWEVPADLTTGTVTLSPGAFTDSRGTRLDFGSSALRVPLSFPAGS